jgi:hypothetical protein
MSQWIFVTPRKGLHVLTPSGTALPPEGALVEKSGYWVRRLRDGDIDISPKPEQGEHE